ncbi:hypothetical protein C8R43DRAFT_1121312 [Mycena crocata]|nr:hypothetical protein C8R43DRAFT_1121312 [Mycena crocata]
MLHAFPVEISTSILDIVIFHGLEPPILPSFELFTRCARVAKVDRYWRDLVNSLSHYWVYILLTHEFPVSCIKTFLGRCDTRDLHFRLSFFDYDGDYDPSDVDFQIAAIRPYVVRAASFEIASDEAALMLQVFHQLKGLPAPVLHDFILSFLFLPYHDHIALDHTPASLPAPATWFTGSFASLTSLRLNKTLLPFAHYVFPSLRRLHLVGSPLHFSADFTALAYVISSSPALEELIVQHLPCMAFPEPGIDVISTSLLRLALVFSPDGTQDLFFRRCFFPNLKSITVDVKGSLEVNSVVAIRRLFDSATSVVITNLRTGPHIVRFDATAMFSILSNVTSLDLTSSRAKFFMDFLLECQQHCRDGFTTVVPFLAVLSVPQVTIQSLITFVNLRRASPDGVQYPQHPVLLEAMFYALTNDLLVEVFDTYLFANMRRDIFSYRIYYRRLANLCAVCPDWRNFLIAQPRFWIYILVASHYPEEAIFTHLDRADTLDLCFRFEFMTYRWPQAAAHIHERAACVLPYIICARSLYAQCSRPEAMHALHSVLSNCDAPRLRILILRFVHQSRHDLTSIAIHPGVVRRWLFADLSKLEVLKVACTLLPFTSFVFPHLRSFHIHGANPQYSMHITTLAHIIQSSPRLHELGVRCLSFTHRLQ